MHTRRKAKHSRPRVQHCHRNLCLLALRSVHTRRKTMLVLAPWPWALRAIPSLRQLSARTRCLERAGSAAFNASLSTKQAKWRGPKCEKNRGRSTADSASSASAVPTSTAERSILHNPEDAFARRPGCSFANAGTSQNAATNCDGDRTETSAKAAKSQARRPVARAGSRHVRQAPESAKLRHSPSRCHLQSACACGRRRRCAQRSSDT